MKKRKKIVYIINHISFFVSHRLDLAKHARNNSFKIFLIAGNESSKKMKSFSQKKIKKNKIKYFRANFSSSSLNLFREIIGFWQVYNYCRNLSPDIIHTASPKANLIGGIVGPLSVISAASYKLSMFTGLILFIASAFLFYYGNIGNYQITINFFDGTENQFFVEGNISDLQSFILSCNNEIVNSNRF